MTDSSRIRVAVAQTTPARSSADALDVIDRQSADAAARGVQLLLFPEAYVGGYPRGAGFGVVVGSRTDAGREAFRRYWAEAIDVPGPAVDRLSAIAARDSLHLVVGVIERDGSTLYCTVLFFAPDGAYLGKHRKLMPTAAERLIWGFGNGSTMPVFDTPLGKLGAVICWENYMPLLRAAHYAKGIELYCAPTADARESWIATMRHVALEGRCFVLAANQYAQQQHYPESYDGSTPEAVVSRGGSCIVDPFGEIVAGPAIDGEALLVADLDRDAIPRARFDFDPVGHYARPDVFTLHVNEADTPAVTFSQGPRPV